MLGLLGLNKITTYIIAAIFVIGLITTTYYIWKKNIEHAALMDFNRQQMEKNAKDQALFLQKQH